MTGKAKAKPAVRTNHMMTAYELRNYLRAKAHWPALKGN